MAKIKNSLEKKSNDFMIIYFYAAQKILFSDSFFHAKLKSPQDIVSRKKWAFEYVIA